MNVAVDHWGADKVGFTKGLGYLGSLNEELGEEAGAASAATGSAAAEPGDRNRAAPSRR